MRHLLSNIAVYMSSITLTECVISIMIVISIKPTTNAMEPCTERLVGVPGGNLL